MPGDEQASAGIDDWLDAQGRMWDAWTDAAGAATSSADADDADPSDPSDEDRARQWRELVGLGLKAWTEEAVPLAKAVGESLAQGRERTAELFELSLRAGRAMLAGGAQAGDRPTDWSAVAKEYVDQLSRLLVRNPLGAPAPLDEALELWRLSFEELVRLQRSWFEESVEGGAGKNGEAGPEPTALRALTDRYWDAWERTFGRLLESPDLGHTRQLTQESTEAMRAWVRFRRAAAEYQFLVADALAEAWSAFVADLVSRVEQDRRPESAREVLRMWGTTIDRVLTERFGQEPYARAQGRLLNAAMAYRLAERAVVDRFLQMSHVPSRTELDEANRAIFDLKRQVRDLQKTVKRLTEEAKPPTAATAAAAAKAAPKPGPKPGAKGEKAT